MKYYLCSAVLLIAVVFSCKAESIDKIVWQNDIAQAMKESGAQDKIVVVDFYTDWCTWCKKLDEETYSDKTVIEKMKDFIPLKVNPESGSTSSEFAKRYSIDGYPTILFLNSSGKVISRVGGYQQAEDFIKSIDAVNKAKNIDNTYVLYKNGDLNAGFELVEAYMALGRLAESAAIVMELDQAGKIPDSKKEDYYMIAGFSLMESTDYTKAATYFQRTCDNAKARDDVYYRAYLYHSYALFLSGDTKNSMKNIQRMAGEKMTPETWKKEYQNFMTWMKNNQDK